MEENKYLLAMMVAKRAKQLQNGAKALVKPKHKKAVLIALQEINEGKVYLKNTSSLEKSEKHKKKEEIKTTEELFKENSV
ncbi:MAG TPA: DNA-directed RNA polymerase subunit omega [Candidatus Atribacteria bacterium]|nr:DNA-directed RNA polymerase subunit omega [Candidatus Atribacteria bacterium]